MTRSGVTYLFLAVALTIATYAAGQRQSTCVARRKSCSVYGNGTTCCPSLECMFPQFRRVSTFTPACAKPGPVPELKNVTFGDEGLFGYEYGDTYLPAVIVLQEWWGVNEVIEDLAKLIAQQGFRVFIPDLYKGNVALSVMEAMHLQSMLNWPMAVQEITEAAQYLIDTGSPTVGITGFCMGGGLSYCAAQFSPVKCAAPFYGWPQYQYCQLDQIKDVPILAQYGALDNRFNEAHARAAEANFTKNSEGVAYVYPNLGHGFLNAIVESGRADLASRGGRPGPENEVVTAFQRLIAFLTQCLK